MRINHIAMYVKNLEAARDFFVRYFEAKSSDRYRNPLTGFTSYFVTFDDGSKLELMYRPVMSDDKKKPNRTGYAHLSISVGSKEKVDDLTERFSTEGYHVECEPRATGDGFYESCIKGIEDNLIEITI
jgi:lactoylglutathione lyase